MLAAFNSRAKAPRANNSFPRPALDQPVAATKGKEVAVISGGCFWGIQAVYEHTRGVISATSGYAGGTADTAQYETVSSGKTGHAESVKVVFDPSEITYGQILMIFFSVAHNPTELNKQGPDWGTQYRSSVFYANPEQKKIAEASKEKLANSGSALKQSVGGKGYGQLTLSLLNEILGRSSWAPIIFGSVWFLPADL